MTRPRPPKLDGPIHFIGIGGIGMSGIAEILAREGHRVTGSDAADGYVLDPLRELGVDVRIGHDSANVDGAACVAISSAIKPGNPELEAAKARGLPIAHRSDLLAELMRGRRSIAVSGTHGKTTTTTLVARLLDGGGLDPTVVNGGVVVAYGSNAKLGSGDWIVAEADESDGSFLKLPADIAVATNADPEHLDFYPDHAAVVAAFERFVAGVPYHGAGVLCADHPQTRAIAAKTASRRMVTYGFADDADVSAENLRIEGGGWRFDLLARGRARGPHGRFEGFALPMPGKHNVSNALAALAVGRELGVADDAARAALAAFEGVKRRFTKVGTWNGATIIDDYAHNPPKIAAAIEAARQVAKGKVIAVVQPHRYTRLKGLFDEFAACLDGADVAFVSDVYSAGEPPIEGASRDALVAAARGRGRADVRALGRPDDLPREIAALAAPGDYVIVLGAGSNTYWANALPKALAELTGRA